MVRVVFRELDRTSRAEPDAHGDRSNLCRERRTVCRRSQRQEPRNLVTHGKWKQCGVRSRERSAKLLARTKQQGLDRRARDAERGSQLAVRKTAELAEQKRV